MKSDPPLTQHRLSPIAVTSPRAVRVRTVARFDSAAADGGGEVQHRAVTNALREQGIDSRPWRPWEDTLGAGDILHVFGSRPEFVPIVMEAKRRGARIALSTIAWFDWRNIWREPESPARRSWHALRYAVRAAWPRLPSWRRRLYHAADVLLPNSQAEAEQLQRLFQVAAAKIRVVPNGIAPAFASATPDAFHDRYGLRDFVLCCGRIEPRKNQLTLIRALAGLGRPLVIIGDAAPGHEAYARACREAADGDVHFLGRLTHDGPLLGSAYAAAACLALVSWFETPGLAALEAAATGTPLVVPACDATREYFGPHAEYVRPYDVGAIRRAVVAACERGRSHNLADIIGSRFTWQHAAAATWEAYAHAN